MTLFSDYYGRIIGGSVGNNMRNSEKDVIGVRSALKAVGRHIDNPESGIITRDMDTAIKSYQKERGLKIDGILLPGGETESALIGDIDRQTDKQIKSLAALMKGSSAKIGNLGEEGDGSEQVLQEEEFEEVPAQAPPSEDIPPESPDAEEDDGQEKEPPFHPEEGTPGHQQYCISLGKTLQEAHRKRSALVRELGVIASDIAIAEAEYEKLKNERFKNIKPSVSPPKGKRKGRGKGGIFLELIPDATEAGTALGEDINIGKSMKEIEDKLESLRIRQKEIDAEIESASKNIGQIEEEARLKCPE